MQLVAGLPVGKLSNSINVSAKITTILIFSAEATSQSNTVTFMRDFFWRKLTVTVLDISK